MRSVFSLCICFFFCAAIATSQEKYSLVRIPLTPEFTIQDAENSGLETDHAVIKENRYIETTASAQTLHFLKENSVTAEILVDDLSLFYKNRAAQSGKFLKDFQKDRMLGGKNIPQNFSLGSMGGFYTLDEIYAQFTSMREKFPDLVSLPEVIGKSIEGRNIVAYRISTPVYTNAKYEVLYTAVHHAREPGGVTTLVYFLWDILERFKNGDIEAKYLLENRELYIIPVINPDGYAYNEKSNPAGGGMWRKNRRKVNDDVYGIDLNRNYGPQESWDAPVNGSSTNPAFETYRGTSPFSEPETQAVRNFCRRHAFKSALNFHTYGGLLIYPFATKQTETPDSATYRVMAAEFIKDNKYAAGTGLQTVGYNVRGDSDEWMYLTEDQKKRIFAVTPEVGTVLDGFWPAPERIIPIAQENLSMNYQFAWSAGVNIRPQFIYSNTQEIFVRCNNIGLLAAPDSIEITATSLHPLVSFGAPLKQLAPLKNTEVDIVSFPFQVYSSFKNGEQVPVLVTIFQKGVMRQDTMEVRIFSPTVTHLFDGMDNGFWSTERWSIITDHFGVRTFTDSPNKNYEDSGDNYLYYTQPIQLSGLNHAMLRFKTRWSIESNADFAVVQVRDDGGVWKTLQTSRMKKGLGIPGYRQEAGQTGFDGNFPEWTIQEASLDEFLHKKIWLRFGVLSDFGGNFDGWYLADIDLLTFQNLPETGITEENFFKDPITIYPNPIEKNGELTITNPFKNDLPVEIQIINLIGEIVYKSKIPFKNGSEKISLQELPAGSYRVVLRQNNKEISEILIILK